VGRGWQRKAHLQVQQSDGGPWDGFLALRPFTLDQNHSTNSDTVGHTSAMATTLPLAARRRVGKEAHCHLRGLWQVVPPLRKALFRETPIASRPQRLDFAQQLATGDRYGYLSLNTWRPPWCDHV